METLLGLCIGIGLSAACGFRVFAPLLLMSVAQHTGHLQLAAGFDWIGSSPALIAFGIATVLEVGTYYIPWLDNAMDTLATPLAVTAGTVVTASMVTDMSPFLRWALALIAGGGVAGAVQGTTVLARGVSSMMTGGFGNPVLATVELGGSLAMGVMAILTPILAVCLLVIGLVLAARKFVLPRLFPATKDGILLESTASNHGESLQNGSRPTR